MIRKHQSLFRATILSSYDYSCCLTGINLPELLIASHINPWATDKKNRLNPHNGLCLNLLHDKAFDSFLITFDDQFKTVVSDRMKKSNKNSELNFILETEGKQIKLPKKFKPSLEFIRMHQKRFEVTNK